MNQETPPRPDMVQRVSPVDVARQLVRKSIGLKEADAAQQALAERLFAPLAQWSMVGPDTRRVEPSSLESLIRQAGKSLDGVDNTGDFQVVEALRSYVASFRHISGEPLRRITQDDIVAAAKNGSGDLLVSFSKYVFNQLRPDEQRLLKRELMA